MTRMSGDWPDWARELDARLPVSPHVVVSGHVDDDHLLDGLPLVATTTVIGRVLRANGYAAVLRWRVGAGVDLLPDGSADAVTRAGITPSGQESTAELAALMHHVVHAGQAHGVRIGLVVEGIPRAAASRTDPERHALYVTARHLLDTAPRRQLPDDVRTGLYNVVVWVVDQENELPPWLIGLEEVPVVSLPHPDLALRKRAAALIAPHLPGWAELDGDGRKQCLGVLATHTEGMPLSAMLAAGELARDRNVAAGRVEDAVRLLRSGLDKRPWSDPEVRKRIAGAAQSLSEEVRGQERAVRTVADALARAALGLSGAHSAGHPSRPQGVLFFAGPTGVGKTELAKQIAKLVFGREEAMQRFDMSEFAAEHTDARLIGSPPGYVGHGAGGELTNAVRQRPFSVLLFDEIEKADPKILDKFLQILEDGRLTDGAGATVHFTETLIIFTSNLGIYHVDEDGNRVPVVHPGDPYDRVRKTVRDAIHEAFTAGIGRPELLNRIGDDNIIVFDFISPKTAVELLDRALNNVATRVAQRSGVELTFAPALRNELAEAVCTDEVLAFGGRKVGSLVEARVVNPLSPALIDKDPGARVEAVSSWQDDTGYHLDVR